MSHTAAKRRAVLGHYQRGASVEAAGAAEKVPYTTAQRWIREAGIARSKSEAASLAIQRRRTLRT